MILNETQSKVLYEIGTVPGSNAFLIAKRLGRDSSGIGRICGALHRQGLISATEKKNIKNAPVNELKLTLIGFPLVIERLIMAGSDHVDDPLPSDYNFRVVSFLRSNEDLHEGIRIYSDFFSFITKENSSASYSRYMLRPLGFALGEYLDQYKFVGEHHPPELLKTEIWERAARNALYSPLFFRIWDFIRMRAPDPLDEIGGVATYNQEEVYFRSKIIPEFQKSEGWGDILDEIQSREYAYNKLKLLKSMI